MHQVGCLQGLVVKLAVKCPTITVSISQSVSVLCVSASYKGDLHLWCRLLLPGAVKRVYNLQNKQLIKLFSKVSDTAIVHGFTATEICLCVPFRCNPVHMS